MKSVLIIGLMLSLLLSPAIENNLDKMSWLDDAYSFALGHTWFKGHGDAFTCVDFSNGLVERLWRSGYSARTRKTTMKDGMRHMFVVLRLPIEPQTGMIIPPEDYWKYGIDRDDL